MRRLLASALRGFFRAVLTIFGFAVFALIAATIAFVEWLTKDEDERQAADRSLTP